jgi:hypothetical protein
MHLGEYSYLIIYLELFHSSPGIDANFTIYERPWGENYERHWGLPIVDSSSRLPLPQRILLRDRRQIRARLRELRLYAADFK